MIPYLEFTQKSLLHFEQLYPNAYVQIHQICKNNDQLLDSLSIFEGDSMAAPNLYLNHFYEIYLDTSDLEGTFSLMENFYRSHLKDIPSKEVVFPDFEQVKGNLGCRLLSLKKNRRLLKDLPFLPFLDLALVYFYTIPQFSGMHACVLITQEHLKAWDVDPNTLQECAMRSAPFLYPAKLMPLADLLFDLMGPEQQMSPVNEPLAYPLYVLTNQEKLYGASAMLYPDVLHDLSDKLSSDLYIIPSSIHEVILLPASEFDQADVLNSLIQEVNTQHLEAEDVLSDHYYYYSRKAKRILPKLPAANLS